MSTLIVVQEASADAASVCAALAASRYHVAIGAIAPTSLASEVVRVAPDVIIACTPSPSLAMLESLRSLSELAPKPVVMFADDTRREVIRSAVAAGVCAYVVDGWASSRLGPIIEAASARFDHYQSLKTELHKAQSRLAERKVIEKAKGLVMQQRGLSEDAAYSGLRKMAMDQNLTLAEVARRVISIAHLLA
jgi:response regulator NasT